MKTRHVYTELSTPCTMTSVSDSIPPLPLRSRKNSQVKIMDCLTNAIQTASNSLTQSQLHFSHTQLCMTQRKPSKISILPLTREKVRVAHKSRRRVDDSNASVCGFHAVSKKQVQNTGKAYIEFFTMLSFLYNKLKRKCFKLEVMIDDLIVYFTVKPERQWNREVADLVKISALIKNNIVESGENELKYESVKQCEGELSKLFFNICYEIYLYKHNLQNLSNLSLIHRDVQYYSRRLGLLNLAILTCMDMGRLCCDFFEMERAAVEYSKAVKLAVFIGDKYSQELAIDRLGMCEYYKGDIVSAHYFHNSTDKLSAYDKWKIYKYYSNQNQIQKILEEKTKEKSLEESIKEQFFRHKENYQFNFDSMTKDNEFVQKNYESFRNNVKEMIKVNSLRKNVPMVKQALTRAEKVGERTYCGRQYRLPRASKYHSRTSGRSREECLISHRSYNRNNLAYESARIDKHCKIIDQILNFFTTEQRTQIRPIKEERESLLSDENSQ